MLRKLLVAVALTLALGACSLVQKLEQGYEATVNAQVPAKEILVAAAAFDAAKITATQYLRLPICPQAAPVCLDPANIDKVDGAVQSGTAARNTLKQFVRQHPGALGPKGTYDVLTSATSVIQDVTAAYRAAKGM